MLNVEQKLIHERALKVAKDLLSNERELIELITKVNREKIFRLLGYANLHGYVVRELKISEGNAYGYIAVARKSEEVPQLKKALDQGNLNVNTARKIVSVLTPENSEDWIGKATNLKQKELEREIAYQNPKKKIRDKIKPVAEDLNEFRCGLSHEEEAIIRRVQDLESQSLRRPVSLRETVRAMGEVYLDKKDPVRKAERLSARIKKPKPQKPPTPGKREVIAANLRHQVDLRAVG